jgi:hypothetical protein
VTDCQGPRPATSLCGFVTVDAGFSCIDRVCVYDCQPGRTCDTALDAGCLTCGASRSCSAATTACNFMQSGVVEADNGCPAGFGPDISLTPIPGDCAWRMTDASGRDLGTVHRLENGGFVLHVSVLGGTCTGFSLATQVERWLVSCPACQFEMRL